MGVIVHNTRDSIPGSEAELFSDIITDFKPDVFSKYSNLKNYYNQALNDTRVLLREYNSRNSNTKASTWESLTDELKEKLQNTKRDINLVQYFQRESRSSQRAKQREIDQAKLEQAMKEERTKASPAKMPAFQWRSSSQPTP